MAYRIRTTSPNLPCITPKPLEGSPYLESQWLRILGDFKPRMIYFGVWWLVISSYLALQVIPFEGSLNLWP